MHDKLELHGREWVRLCRAADVVERRGRRVEVDIEFDLALFRVQGRVVCVSNVCPHQRIPVLYDGHINNGVVTCPMHGWEFDLCNRDGRRPGLRHYETLEHEGWVYAILQ